MRRMRSSRTAERDCADAIIRDEEHNDRETVNGFANASAPPPMYHEIAATTLLVSPETPSPPSYDDVMAKPFKYEIVITEN